MLSEVVTSLAVVDAGGPRGGERGARGPRALRPCGPALREPAALPPRGERPEVLHAGRRLRGPRPARRERRGGRLPPGRAAQRPDRLALRAGPITARGPGDPRARGRGRAGRLPPGPAVTAGRVDRLGARRGARPAGGDRPRRRVRPGAAEREPREGRPRRGAPGERAPGPPGRGPRPNPAGGGRRRRPGPRGGLRQRPGPRALRMRRRGGLPRGLAGAEARAPAVAGRGPRGPGRGAGRSGSRSRRGARCRPSCTGWRARPRTTSSSSATRAPSRRSRWTPASSGSSRASAASTARSPTSCGLRSAR